MRKEDKQIGEEFLKKYQKFLEENGFKYGTMAGLVEDVAVSFEKKGFDTDKTMEIVFHINKRSKKILANIFLMYECLKVQTQYFNIPFDTIMNMIKNGNIKFGELRKYLWDWDGENPEHYQNENDFWNDDECKEDEDE